MTNDGVDQKLVQYLNASTPSYAVLLRGPWGVGKSFYWRHFAQTRLPALEKKDITFSVAGLGSLAELERAAFLASIEDLGTGLLRETGTVVGRALLRWVKVNPDDIHMKADVRSDRTVVCIDDIERFGGDFKILFGFIISLLDDAKLHVVLIADEQRALGKLGGYREYKERIVARSFNVFPQIGAFYEDVVNGYAHEKTREALLDIESHALELFGEKHLSNLRTVRSVLDEMNTLLSEMRWPDGDAASLSSLLSAVMFHALATSQSAEYSGLVGRAFLIGNLGMALIFHRKDETGSSSTEGGDELEAVASLIKSLGFEGDAYEWPVSSGFAAYVNGETFDANAIASDFMVFGKIAREDVSVLEKFQHYRRMSDVELGEATNSLWNMITDHKLDSVQQMWNSYEILDHLAAERLIDQNEKECLDKFLMLISDYDAAKLSSTELEIWPGERNANQKTVIERLQELESQGRQIQEKASNERILRSILEGDDGAAKEEDGSREINSEPFGEAIPSEIYERLISSGRPGIYRMEKFFRRRLSISNIAEFTSGDGPFASALASLIDSKVPEHGRISLDQAALRSLSIVLKKFALVVERWKSRDEKTA